MEILIPVKFTEKRLKELKGSHHRTALMKNNEHVQHCKLKPHAKFENICQQSQITNLPINQKILQTQESLTKSQRFCRICLQEQRSTEQLLYPCECNTGIHQKCLIEWVSKRSVLNKSHQLTTCQVCLSEYKVKFLNQKYLSCQMLKFQMKYSCKSVLFSILYLFLGYIVLGSLAYCILLLSTSSTALKAVESFVLLTPGAIFSILGFTILASFSVALGLTKRFLSYHCTDYRFVICRDK